MPKHNESVSGFKVSGAWSEIVEHGERVAHALEQAGVEGYEEEFEDYNEWRPKMSERLSKDINSKTARKASIDDEDEEPPGKNIKQAGEKVTESYERKDQPNRFFKKLVSSFKHTGKAVVDSLRIAIRGTEEKVYKDFMTKISPYYFDNRLVSADIKKSSRSTYVMEVNVNDYELKQEVSDLLREYEDKYERWHVSTKYDPKIVEHSEGGEDYSELDETDEENTDPNMT